MTKVDLLSKYLSNLRPDGSPSYPHMAKRFCAWLEEREPSRETIDKFLEKLKREGYAPGSQSAYFGMIRSMLRANGLEWPYRRGEAPTVSERDVNAPRLSVALITKLLDVSIKFRSEHRAYLALSTTYGIRREEIREIGPHSFDWKVPSIYIKTAKHGRERYHLIPEQIAPFLQGHDWRPRSPQYLSQCFVELLMGIILRGERTEGVGWHAIRRSLVHVLFESGLNEAQVDTFLRWRRSSSSMARRYYNTMEIAEDGTTAGPELADADLDRKAFAVNPWLPKWAEMQEAMSEAKSAEETVAV